MVVSKLFRNPQDAARAVSALKQKGFAEKEISILAPNKKGIDKLFQGKVSELSRGDKVVASGFLAAALSGGADLMGSLAKALETSAEKVEYYQFGVSTGGALVSVHAGEHRAPEAQEVLRETESIPARQAVRESSPGFIVASRMSATNPIDAPMSGDFRKY